MDKLSISAMFIKVGHMITGTMSCHMILSLSLIGWQTHLIWNLSRLFYSTGGLPLKDTLIGKEEIIPQKV